MKNLRTIARFFACALICASLFTACKKGDDGKNGATGAAGTAGTAGAAGAAGATGGTGINGNTMLNGTGIPADTTGVAGDFYLDLDSRMLYGPKTADGWGDGVGIQGPVGEMGPAGPNDIFIDTFTIYNSYWANRSSFNFRQQTDVNNTVYWPGMDYGRYNPSITNSILSSGVIIVDMKLSPVSDPFHWSQLPYTSHAGNFDMNLEHREGTQFIELDYYLTPNYNNVAPATSDIESLELPDYQVKVIVIPAAVITVIDRVMKEQKAKVKMN